MLNSTIDEDKKEEEFLKDLERTCLGKHFSTLFINPQGQLSLELNRPIIFSESLAQVAKEGDRYGFANSSEVELSEWITLSHCTCAVRRAETTKTDIPESNVPSAMCAVCECHDDAVSLEEGRIVIFNGVLSNVLQATGHKVQHYRLCNVSDM